MPGATVDQVRSKIQISAKPGYAYGLQLVTVPPWFPIEVGVVMSVVLPTHLGPSAFCGVSVAVVTGLPTRWGPSAPAAASVSGISSVGLVGLFASIVLSCVCRRLGSTVPWQSGRRQLLQVRVLSQSAIESPVATTSSVECTCSRSHGLEVYFSCHSPSRTSMSCSVHWGSSEPSDG